MARPKGSTSKRTLTPGAGKKHARKAKEHRPLPTVDVVVDSAPVGLRGSSGALPRSKRTTAPHVKAALERALATSEGKDPPPVSTKGVDKVLVKEFSETTEERIAREDAETAKIDAKIGGVEPEPSMEREAVFYPAKKPGRPTLYRPEFCDIVRRYYEAGATDFEVAELLDVSVAVIPRWRAEHLEFRLACQLGKDAADNEVETSFYQNAKGYYRKTEKLFQFQGVPFRVESVEHVPGDVGAQKHWLANRKPLDWRADRDLPPTDPLVNAIGQMTMVELARRLALTLTQGMRAEEATIDVTADPAS